MASNDQSLDVGGPVNSESLLHGEKLAVNILSRFGRRNRSRVRVRIIGDHYFSWVDIVHKWGACIEVVVVDNSQLRSLLKSKYHCEMLSIPQASKLPPHKPWHGLVFASAHSLRDKESIHSLFEAWLPGSMLIAVHGRISHKETAEFVPVHGPEYSCCISKARHSEFGGATISVWNIIHLSRTSTSITMTVLLTSEHYPQTLQASLDDTQGVSQDRFHFEPCFGEPYIGNVKLRKTGVEL